ncbi:unnamed protein product [Penicillium roqueforti FM164]|uniref:Uncharacterized protein n=1 Tax=Penicillium roqueforti (strain FM164) TaxID=1365484 RepID=W6R8F3_PENRF|nr:unnamed protein product [Penicillium roqueforti FM164]
MRTTRQLAMSALDQDQGSTEYGGPTPGTLILRHHQPLRASQWISMTCWIVSI